MEAEVDMDRPNCYKCAYRGEVPGSCHSSCNHPEAKLDANKIIDILRGATPMPISKLGVEGNAHGIRKGWFAWPVNFDPVWLLSCNGFVEKNEELIL